MAKLYYTIPDEDPLDGEVEIWLEIAGIHLLSTPSLSLSERRTGHILMTDPIDLAIWGMVAIRQAMASGKDAYHFPEGEDMLFWRRDDLMLLHLTGHSRREAGIVVGMNPTVLTQIWRDFADRLRIDLRIRGSKLLGDPDWQYFENVPPPPSNYWHSAFQGHERCFASIAAIESASV